MSQQKQMQHAASSGDNNAGTQVKIPIALQVDTSAIAIMAASYNKHFEVYSRGRTNVTQGMPAKVWQQVYKDFLQYCQDLIDSAEDPEIKTVSDLKLKSERTYKKNLHEALKKIGTGVSNPSGSEKVVLQQNEVLQRLKQTDDHSRRLMMKKRGNVISPPSTAGSQPQDGPADASSVAGASQRNVVKAPLSKTEIMQKGVIALDIMADSVASTGNRMNEILAEELKESKRRSQVVENSYELRVKRLKMDEDKHGLDSKIAQQRLQMDVEKSQMEKLKFLFDNGVLTKEEFQTRSLALLG